MTKPELRKSIRASKSLLTDGDRLRDADAVFAEVERSHAFIAASHVLIYSALPDELPTRQFIDKWSGAKTLYLPRVNGDDLDILPYRAGALCQGAFGIDEPLGNDPVDIATIDLIIVPGVAFDRHGNRLGRGKGFYDRLLRQTQATKIGVGHDCQLIDEIPADPHDIPMDIVITPSATITPRQTNGGCALGE